MSHTSPTTPLPQRFFVYFKPSVPSKTASVAIDWIEDLGKELGLLFQPAKMICPTTHLEFLGLELDSQAMEAHLPIKKLGYLSELLDTWMGCKSCILKELQEIIGLQFCAQSDPPWQDIHSWPNNFFQ